ncbi:MAG: major capsid protein [Planctomycetota bacterium]
MAVSARSDVVIPEILETEQYRGLAEILDVFNQASGGCIVLSSANARQASEGGEYTQWRRFKSMSSLDSRVDTANPANAATAIKLEMASGASVRQTRRLGPVNFADDAAAAAGQTREQWSANIGLQFAETQFKTIRNNAIAAAVAAVDSADTTDGSTASADIHVLDVARGQVSGAKVPITAAYLNQLLGKMADHREDIELFVMPSAVFTDLVGDQIANFQVDRIAGTLMVTDVPAAFGRKLLVADIPALETALTSGYYTKYFVLGLGRGALRADITADGPVEADRDLDTESVRNVLRKDYWVDYLIKGMKWAPGSATPNPTDAQLATAANWDEDYDDHRDLSVVKLVVNAG